MCQHPSTQLRESQGPSPTFCPGMNCSPQALTQFQRYHKWHVLPMTQPTKLFKSFKIRLHYISLLFALMHSAQVWLHVKQRSCRNELALLLYQLLTCRLCHPELAESCPEIKPLGKRREFFSPLTANFTAVGCFCSLRTKDYTFLKYSFCEIFCDLRAV